MKQSEIEARETLLKMIKPGDTVYTILRSRSRSGMSRQIGVVVPTKNGNDFFHPNYATATLIGAKVNKNGDGVTVSGCGMDMGFHIVYNLGRALFPDGFGCVGDGSSEHECSEGAACEEHRSRAPSCPANDHSNGDRDYTPHDSCNCRQCPVCKGMTVCGECQTCARCNDHKPNCKGCSGTQGRKIHWHKDGGYALRHRWL